MAMYSVEKFSRSNAEKLKNIYQDFCDKALIDYKFEDSPIAFEQFVENIESNKLGALFLFKDSNPEGVLIYTLENYDVIEINIIHLLNTENENEKRILLTKELQNLLKTENKTISYTMLGKQESFVHDIARLNFKFVGQSIAKFDFKDPVSYKILKTAEIPDLNSYKMSIWNDKYKDQITELMHLAFKNTKNSKFDPRFLTLDGSQDVLNMVLTNQYGAFLPSQTRILLNDGNVEGFCFVTMVAEDKINIPLIATRKHVRNKGMGKLVLKSVLSGFMQLIAEKKIALKEINATVDTDNYPAVKMYRRLGFREDTLYPHAYYKN